MTSRASAEATSRTTNDSKQKRGGFSSLLSKAKSNDRSVGTGSAPRRLVPFVSRRGPPFTNRNNTTKTGTAPIATTSTAPPPPPPPISSVSFNPAATRDDNETTTVEDPGNLTDSSRVSSLTDRDGLNVMAAAEAAAAAAVAMTTGGKTRAATATASSTTVAAHKLFDRQTILPQPQQPVIANSSSENRRHSLDPSVHSSSQNRQPQQPLPSQQQGLQQRASKAKSLSPRHSTVRAMGRTPVIDHSNIQPLTTTRSATTTTPTSPSSMDFVESKRLSTTSPTAASKINGASIRVRPPTPAARPRSNKPTRSQAEPSPASGAAQTEEEEVDDEQEEEEKEEAAQNDLKMARGVTKKIPLDKVKAMLNRVAPARQGFEPDADAFGNAQRRQRPHGSEPPEQASISQQNTPRHANTSARDPSAFPFGMGHLPDPSLNYMGRRHQRLQLQPSEASSPREGIEPPSVRQTATSPKGSPANHGGIQTVTGNRSSRRRPQSASSPSSISSTSRRSSSVAHRPPTPRAPLDVSEEVDEEEEEQPQNRYSQATIPASATYSTPSATLSSTARTVKRQTHDPPSSPPYIPRSSIDAPEDLRRVYVSPRGEEEDSEAQVDDEQSHEGGEEETEEQENDHDYKSQELTSILDAPDNSIQKGRSLEENHRSSRTALPDIAGAKSLDVDAFPDHFTFELRRPPSKEKRSRRQHDEEVSLGEFLDGTDGEDQIRVGDGQNALVADDSNEDNKINEPNGPAVGFSDIVGNITRQIQAQLDNVIDLDATTKCLSPTSTVHVPPGTALEAAIDVEDMERTLVEPNGYEMGIPNDANGEAEVEPNNRQLDPVNTGIKQNAEQNSTEESQMKPVTREGRATSLVGSRTSRRSRSRSSRHKELVAAGDGSIRDRILRHTASSKAKTKTPIHRSNSQNRLESKGNQSLLSASSNKSSNTEELKMEEVVKDKSESKDESSDGPTSSRDIPTSTNESKTPPSQTRPIRISKRLNNRRRKPLPPRKKNNDVRATVSRKASAMAKKHNMTKEISPEEAKVIAREALLVSTKQQTDVSLPEEISLSLYAFVSDLDQSVKHFPLNTVDAEGSEAVSALEAPSLQAISFESELRSADNIDRYAPLNTTPNPKSPSNFNDDSRPSDRYETLTSSKEQQKAMQEFTDDAASIHDDAAKDVGRGHILADDITEWTASEAEGGQEGIEMVFKERTKSVDWDTKSKGQASVGLKPRPRAFCGSGALLHALALDDEHEQYRNKKTTEPEAQTKSLTAGDQTPTAHTSPNDEDDGVEQKGPPDALALDGQNPNQGGDGDSPVRSRQDETFDDQNDDKPSTPNSAAKTSTPVVSHKKDQARKPSMRHRKRKNDIRISSERNERDSTPLPSKTKGSPNDKTWSKTKQGVFSNETVDDEPVVSEELMVDSPGVCEDTRLSSKKAYGNYTPTGEMKGPTSKKPTSGNPLASPKRQHEKLRLTVIRSLEPSGSESSREEINEPNEDSEASSMDIQESCYSEEKDDSIQHVQSSSQWTDVRSGDPEMSERSLMEKVACLNEDPSGLNLFEDIKGSRTGHDPSNLKVEGYGNMEESNATNAVNVEQFDEKENGVRRKKLSTLGSFQSSLGKPNLSKVGAISKSADMSDGGNSTASNSTNSRASKVKVLTELGEKTLLLSPASKADLKARGTSASKKTETDKKEGDPESEEPELIDLTAIGSFEDLGIVDEAVWLFDVSPRNSVDQDLWQPKSNDLDSVMDLAVARLTQSTDRYNDDEVAAPEEGVAPKPSTTVKDVLAYASKLVRNESSGSGMSSLFPSFEAAREQMKESDANNVDKKAPEANQDVSGSAPAPVFVVVQGQDVGQVESTVVGVVKPNATPQTPIRSGNAPLSNLGAPSHQAPSYHGQTELRSPVETDTFRLPTKKPSPSPLGVSQQGWHLSESEQRGHVDPEPFRLPPRKPSTGFSFGQPSTPPVDKSDISILDKEPFRLPSSKSSPISSAETSLSAKQTNQTVPAVKETGGKSSPEDKSSEGLLQRDFGDSKSTSVQVGKLLLRKPSPESVPQSCSTSTASLSEEKRSTEDSRLAPFPEKPTPRSSRQHPWKKPSRIRPSPEFINHTAFHQRDFEMDRFELPFPPQKPISSLGPAASTGDDPVDNTRHPQSDGNSSMVTKSSTKDSSDVEEEANIPSPRPIAYISPVSHTGESQLPTETTGEVAPTEFDPRLSTPSIDYSRNAFDAPLQPGISCAPRSSDTCEKPSAHSDAPPSHSDPSIPTPVANNIGEPEVQDPSVRNDSPIGNTVIGSSPPNERSAQSRPIRNDSPIVSNTGENDIPGARFAETQFERDDSLIENSNTTSVVSSILGSAPQTGCTSSEYSESQIDSSTNTRDRLTEGSGSRRETASGTNESLLDANKPESVVPVPANAQLEPPTLFQETSTNKQSPPEYQLTGSSGNVRKQDDQLVDDSVLGLVPKESSRLLLETVHSLQYTEQDTSPKKLEALPKSKHQSQENSDELSPGLGDAEKENIFRNLGTTTDPAQNVPAISQLHLGSLREATLENDPTRTHQTKTNPAESAQLATNPASKRDLLDIFFEGAEAFVCGSKATSPTFVMPTERGLAPPRHLALETQQNQHLSMLTDVDSHNTGPRQVDNSHSIVDGEIKEKDALDCVCEEAEKTICGEEHVPTEPASQRGAGDLSFRNDDVIVDDWTQNSRRMVQDENLKIGLKTQKDGIDAFGKTVDSHANPLEEANAGQTLHTSPPVARVVADGQLVTSPVSFYNTPRKETITSSVDQERQRVRSMSLLDAGESISRTSSKDTPADTKVDGQSADTEGRDRRANEGRETEGAPPRPGAQKDALDICGEAVESHVCPTNDDQAVNHSGTRKLSSPSSVLAADRNEGREKSGRTDERANIAKENALGAFAEAVESHLCPTQDDQVSRPLVVRKLLSKEAITATSPTRSPTKERRQESKSRNSLERSGRSAKTADNQSSDRSLAFPTETGFGGPSNNGIHARKEREQLSNANHREKQTSEKSHDVGIAKQGSFAEHVGDPIGVEQVQSDWDRREEQNRVSTAGTQAGYEAGGAPITQSDASTQRRDNTTILTKESPLKPSGRNESSATNVSDDALSDKETSFNAVPGNSKHGASKENDHAMAYAYLKGPNQTERNVDDILNHPYFEAALRRYLSNNAPTESNEDRLRGVPLGHIRARADPPTWQEVVGSMNRRRDPPSQTPTPRDDHSTEHGDKDAQPNSIQYDLELKQSNESNKQTDETPTARSDGFESEHSEKAEHSSLPTTTNQSNVKREEESNAGNVNKEPTNGKGNEELGTVNEMSADDVKQMSWIEETEEGVEVMVEDGANEVEVMVEDGENDEFSRASTNLLTPESGVLHARMNFTNSLLASYEDESSTGASESDAASAEEAKYASAKPFKDTGNDMIVAIEDSLDQICFPQKHRASTTRAMLQQQRSPEFFLRPVQKVSKQLQQLKDETVSVDEVLNARASEIGSSAIGSPRHGEQADIHMAVTRSFRNRLSSGDDRSSLVVSDYESGTGVMVPSVNYSSSQSFSKHSAAKTAASDDDSSNLLLALTRTETESQNDIDEASSISVGKPEPQISGTVDIAEDDALSSISRVERVRMMLDAGPDQRVPSAPPSQSPSSVEPMPGSNSMIEAGSNDRFARSPRVDSVLEKLRQRRDTKRAGLNDSAPVVPAIDSGPVDADALFSRYNTIVKRMVVADSSRLERIQERKAVESSEQHVVDVTSTTGTRYNPLNDEISSRSSSHNHSHPSTLARRVRNHLPVQSLMNSGSHGSSSEQSTTPSEKARDLRRQLDHALQTSVEIRGTQERLTAEISTFKTRLQHQRKAVRSEVAAIAAGIVQGSPRAMNAGQYPPPTRLSPIASSDAETDNVTESGGDTSGSETDEDDVRLQQLDSIIHGLRDAQRRQDGDVQE